MTKVKLILSLFTLFMAITGVLANSVFLVVTGARYDSSKPVGERCIVLGDCYYEQSDYLCTYEGVTVTRALISAPTDNCPIAVLYQPWPPTQ